MLMATTTSPKAAGERGTVDLPVALAHWRTRELRLAHTFRECAGASTAEIEELYDATVLALLPRPYESEEHLRFALRKGIKMRALRLHRDRAGTRVRAGARAGADRPRGRRDRRRVPL